MLRGTWQRSIRKYDFGFTIYEVLGFSAPGGRGNWNSQARSGCFHFSPFTRARSASFHDGRVGFPNACGKGGYEVLLGTISGCAGRYPCCAWTIYLTGAERLFSLFTFHASAEREFSRGVAEFPNGRFVGRFCSIGNDIREPGLADVGSASFHDGVVA